MYKARILIAFGMAGSMIVVTTDNPLVVEDADALSGNVDDMGILQGADRLQDLGLYLWTGTLKQLFAQTADGEEPDGLTYTGTLRRVEPHEIAELLAMAPSWESLEQA